MAAEVEVEVEFEFEFEFEFDFEISVFELGLATDELRLWPAAAAKALPPAAAFSLLWESVMAGAGCGGRGTGRWTLGVGMTEGGVGVERTAGRNGPGR